MYEIFHVREYLTRRAYKHETASSINLMITEAIAEADKYRTFIWRNKIIIKKFNFLRYYNFSSIIQNCDLEKFERLNDNIFLEILYSEDEKLKNSKDILDRIVKRKLYKYVGSVLLPKCESDGESDGESDNGESDKKKVKI